MKKDNELSVNDYVENILPEEDAEKFRILTECEWKNRNFDNRYQDKVEKFISKLSKEVKDKIINSLKKYCDCKFKVTSHCLARIIGRYGKMSFKMTLLRVWEAICSAKRQIQKFKRGATKRRRPERASAEDITVVFDDSTNTLITLYSSALAWQ